jgi:cytoskeleton protein RodZ
MASFGDNLRQQRELRGISLRDISEATKISVRFLQALETDRVDILPGGIFRRSFVREYARFVGLDPERMVAEFLHAHGDPASERGEKKPAAPAQPEEGSRRGFYRRLFLALGAVGLLGGAWALARAVPPPASSASAPVAAPPMVVPGDQLVPMPEPVATLDGPLVVTLRARQDCWVALHAGGRALMDKVLRAGDSETVQVDDEVILHVGDAGALELLINDQPASPLGDRGEVRRNIVINKNNLPSLVEAPTARRAAHSG